MNDSLGDLKECLVIIINFAVVVLSDRGVAMGTGVLSLRDLIFTSQIFSVCVSL